jgi:hypothetical protein
MSIISLLIVLLIFCLVIWAVRAILGAFGIGDPFSTIVQVIFVLIFVLWIVQSLGFLSGGPTLRIH